jgi:hypothetical protein
MPREMRMSREVHRGRSIRKTDQCVAQICDFLVSDDCPYDGVVAIWSPTLHIGKRMLREIAQELQEMGYEPTLQLTHLQLWLESKRVIIYTTGAEYLLEGMHPITYMKWSD